MLEAWRNQFTMATLKLRHDDPSVFVKSEWQGKESTNVYYLIYRILITIYLIICWILSIVDVSHPNEPTAFYVKWLIYLTNWGFTLCTLQSIIAAVMMISYMYLNKNGVEQARINNSFGCLKLYKVYWALNIMATDFAFAITGLYWSLVYNAETMPADFMNLMVHATNSMVMLFELLVVSHPVVLLHSYLPLSAAVIYVFFTLIYYLAGGTSRSGEATIYPVLNWSKPLSTTLLAFGAILSVLLIHCFTFLVYRGRVILARNILRDDDESDRNHIPVQETFKGYDNEAMANETV